jgi:hypothetical protein
MHLFGWRVEPCFLRAYSSYNLNIIIHHEPHPTERVVPQNPLNLKDQALS